MFSREAPGMPEGTCGMVAAHIVITMCDPSEARGEHCGQTQHPSEERADQEEADGHN